MKSHVGYLMLASVVAAHVFAEEGTQERRAQLALGDLPAEVRATAQREAGKLTVRKIRQTGRRPPKGDALPPEKTVYDLYGTIADEAAQITIKGNGDLVSLVETIGAASIPAEVGDAVQRAANPGALELTGAKRCTEAEGVSYEVFARAANVVYHIRLNPDGTLASLTAGAKKERSASENPHSRGEKKQRKADDQQAKDGKHKPGKKPKPSDPTPAPEVKVDPNGWR